MSNEYGFSQEDATQSSGGGFTAKPRGNYEGIVEGAETKKDKNGKVYLKFALKIAFGPRKGGKAFENYLPLSNTVNKFQLARRNSFLRAILLQAGSIPPGAPGGPSASVLNGALVGFQLEHEFQNVPGEDYSITTSKSAKSAWVQDGWEERLNEKGELVKAKNGSTIPEPIKPRETVVFYQLSDDFEGLVDDTASDEADTEGWG